MLYSTKNCLFPNILEYINESTLLQIIVSDFTAVPS
jgi:hypothetical protein